jgi:hypothetical protein
MPAITKKQAKDVLAFILTDILEDDEDDGTAGPIQLALRQAKVKGILDVNSMLAATIKTLDYTNVTTKLVIPLKKGEIGLLKTFHAYIYYRDSIGEPIDSMEK